jgi:hypothetical protein
MVDGLHLSCCYKRGSLTTFFFPSTEDLRRKAGLRLREDIIAHQRAVSSCGSLSAGVLKAPEREDGSVN